MKSILLVLCFVAISLAQVSPPTWPTAFSATILAIRQHNGRAREDVVRWFYDYSQQKERFDGPAVWHNEFYMAMIINDYNAELQSAVFFQEDVATCIQRSINWTMPDPDFSTFKYMGTSIVGMWKANYFTQQDSRGDWFNLWSKQDNNEILRINLATPNFREETWTFLEMDVNSQDSTLFDLPELLQGTCTQIGN